MKPSILIVVALCIAGSFSFAQTSLIEPLPGTATQDSLIKVGTALHDEGRYDEAINVYQRILRENPSHVVALYELSYTLFTKKDFDGALKYSTEGAKYRSKFHSLFFLNAGNALDNLGRSDEAITIYREGMSGDPEYYLFPYNLGLAYYRKALLDSARHHFQNALRLNPAHPSSNIALAAVYHDMGKNIPRLFALARFLVLEPASPRAKDALDQLHEVLGKYVSVDKSNAQNIKISITPDSDAVDGDLTTLEMSLAITQATRHTDEGKGKSEIQWTVYAFQTFFQIMLEVRGHQSFGGFCWEYYAPYFIEIQRRGYTEAFVHLLFRGSGVEEVDSWLKSNAEKEREFLTWSKNFAWAN